MNWTDLKDLVDLPESTLNRYLGYLEFWGLAKKNNEGCWDWHERVRIYKTEHDYNIALEHSTKLMKTVENYFGASMINPEWFQKQAIQSLEARDQLYLTSMIREHLRTGYPPLFDEVITFDQSHELRKTIATELSSKMPKIDGAKKVDYVANFRVLKAYVIPKKYRREVEKTVAIIGPERTDFIEQTMKKYTRSLLKIDSELRRLRYEVEHGEPLKGTCALCPKSRVLC